jgi:hypothetical protein
VNCSPSRRLPVRSQPSWRTADTAAPAANGVCARIAAATSAARLILAMLLALAAASCEDETVSPGEPGDTTATSGATTTSAPTVTSATATTTATSGTTATTQPPYGSACQKGSHPDCIDPDQDGRYECLKGGAECMKDFGEDSGLCSDLDGDGVAGYPDSG